MCIGRGILRLRGFFQYFERVETIQALQLGVAFFIKIAIRLEERRLTVGGAHNIEIQYAPFGIVNGHIRRNINLMVIVYEGDFLIIFLLQKAESTRSAIFGIVRYLINKTEI